MDINEIKRRTELLQQATLQDCVPIKDVARELKTNVTDLMQFILDNPDLFHTEEVWTYKKESYIEHTRFGSSRSTRKVKDKCKGLGIKAVYRIPEDNPCSDEHIALRQQRDARTVWLSEWDNWGTTEGFHVEEDKPDDKDEFRKHLWRNTAEKIAELKNLGILKNETFFIGGAFDASEHNTDTAISDEAIARARALGWTVITPKQP